MAEDNDIRRCFLALHNALLQPITDDKAMNERREDTVRTALNLLGKYGISEEILRYGFTETIITPLLFRLVGAVGDAIYPPSLTGRWSTITGISATRDRMSTFPDMLARFARWVREAPLFDIINLNPPTVQDWNALLLKAPETSDIVIPYHWLADRYLQSDITAWPTSSLHMEYRYLHDGDTADFPMKALDGEPVTVERLDAEIARRAVYETTESTTRHRLYLQVYSAALNYLKHRDYKAAATLFDFYLDQYPGDANALNSKGFCMIPQDAGAAEKHVKQALRHGLKPQTVGIYNICCCKIRQKDMRSALRIADAYWIETDDASETPTSAVLWDPVPDDCGMIDCKDVRRALTGLCVICADRLGDKEKTMEWRRRAHGLATARQS